MSEFETFPSKKHSCRCLNFFFLFLFEVFSCQDMPGARPAAVRIALRSKVTCAVAYDNKKKKNKEHKENDQPPSPPRATPKSKDIVESSESDAESENLDLLADLPVTLAAALPASHFLTHHLLHRYPPVSQTPQQTLLKIFNQ